MVYWGQSYILDVDFYRALLETTRELHAISGLWARSRKYRLESTAPQLELLLLTEDEHDYLVALNRGASPISFSAGMPWSGRQVLVHFENRVVSCHGGVLSDTLPAFGVHMYSIDDLPSPLCALPDFAGGGYAEQEPLFDCDGAGWIWAKDLSEVPGSKVNLYREFTVEPGRAVKEVVLTIGADDYAEVIVNGQRLGAAGNCRYLKRFADLDVTPGRNFIGVEALDGGGLPCGVIGALEIRYEDGGVEIIPTDESWWVVPEVPTEWTAVRMDTLSEHAFVVSGLHSGKWVNVWSDQLRIR